MSISAKQMGHVAEFERKHYYKTLVRFKKEDEARIRAAATATGSSINAFMAGAVLDKVAEVLPEIPEEEQAEDHDKDQGGVTGPERVQDVDAPSVPASGQTAEEIEALKQLQQSISSRIGDKPENASLTAEEERRQALGWVACADIPGLADISKK